MPHYKCVACKTRLYNAITPPDPVGDLCLECGSLLEPAGELSELVGFRLITSRLNEGATDALGTDRPSVGRIDDFLTRRYATLVQARLDAERWADEGGNLHAEAVAVAPPRPETNS